MAGRFVGQLMSGTCGLLHLITSLYMQRNSTNGLWGLGNPYPIDPQGGGSRISLGGGANLLFGIILVEKLKKKMTRLD